MVELSVSERGELVMARLDFGVRSKLRVSFGISGASDRHNVVRRLEAGRVGCVEALSHGQMLEIPQHERYSCGLDMTKTRRIHG